MNSLQPHSINAMACAIWDESENEPLDDPNPKDEERDRVERPSEEEGDEGKAEEEEEVEMGDVELPQLLSELVLLPDPSPLGCL
nr:hypothetical protein BaRGS_025770 [Batillaria attramentaria]